MTRPATDDTGEGRPGRARKRITALLNDAWEVKTWADGEGWYIVAPLDVDIWQAWRRVDKEWCEMLERGLRRDELTNLLTGT